MRSFRSTLHLSLLSFATVDREELAELRRPRLYLLLQVVAKLLAVSAGVAWLDGGWLTGGGLLVACVVMTWAAAAFTRADPEPR